MKNRPLTLLILILMISSLRAAEMPRHVVSINLCTDQLLLMLGRSNQITSVSQLALDPNSSFMASEAARYPTNHAKAEEIIDYKPDLIVASPFNDHALIKLLKKLGYRVEIFPLANTIGDIRNNIRRMARLVQRQGQGEKLIAQMDHRLTQISRQRPSTRPRGAFYQPNGYTSGRHTLQDAALRLAGWDNIASSLGVVGYGAIDLERLMLAKPQQLFTSSYAPGTQSLGQRLLQHPALRRLTAGRAPIEVSYKYWICGGPMIADAVEILHRSLPQ